MQPRPDPSRSGLPRPNSRATRLKLGEKMGMPPSHVLYRFYDDSGVLLYVGRTINPYTRFKNHSRAKSWWQSISDIKMARFQDDVSLAAAEIDAIRSEKPLHNVVHNTGRVVHERRPRSKSRRPSKSAVSAKVDWENSVRVSLLREYRGTVESNRT